MYIEANIRARFPSQNWPFTASVQCVSYYHSRKTKPKPTHHSSFSFLSQLFIIKRKATNVPKSVQNQSKSIKWQSSRICTYVYIYICVCIWYYEERMRWNERFVTFTNGIEQGDPFVGQNGPLGRFASVIHSSFIFFLLWDFLFCFLPSQECHSYFKHFLGLLLPVPYDVYFSIGLYRLLLPQKKKKERAAAATTSHPSDLFFRCCCSSRILNYVKSWKKQTKKLVFFSSDPFNVLFILC